MRETSQIKYGQYWVNPLIETAEKMILYIKQNPEKFPEYLEGNERSAMIHLTEEALNFFLSEQGYLYGEESETLQIRIPIEEMRKIHRYQRSEIIPGNIERFINNLIYNYFESYVEKHIVEEKILESYSKEIKIEKEYREK